MVPNLMTASQLPQPSLHRCHNYSAGPVCPAGPEPIFLAPDSSIYQPTMLLTPSGAIRAQGHSQDQESTQPALRKDPLLWYGTLTSTSLLSNLICSMCVHYESKEMQVSKSAFTYVIYAYMYTNVCAYKHTYNTLRYKHTIHT